MKGQDISTGGVPQKVGGDAHGIRAPSFLPTPAKNGVWPLGVQD